MKLSRFFLSLSLMLMSISAYAKSIPLTFPSEFGTVTRVMGAFQDRRTDDAFFVAGIETQERKTQYAWFLMSGDNQAVHPITALQDSAEDAFNLFQHQLKSSNRMDIFLRVGLRFGRFHVLNHADEWAEKLFRHPESERPIAHRHFRYLLRSFL